MASTSQEIIQDVREQFEQMMECVTGEQARTATADHIECGLFKMVLSLGAKMLQLFFTMRTQTSARRTIQAKTGQELPYHRDTAREYFSIFGKMSFERPYFYKKGVGGQTPTAANTCGMLPIACWVKHTLIK